MLFKYYDYVLDFSSILCWEYANIYKYLRLSLRIVSFCEKLKSTFQLLLKEFINMRERGIFLLV